jgi:hypothetical protein
VQALAGRLPGMRGSYAGRLRRAGICITGV